MSLTSYRAAPSRAKQIGETRSQRLKLSIMNGFFEAMFRARLLQSLATSYSSDA